MSNSEKQLTLFSYLSFQETIMSNQPPVYLHNGQHILRGTAAIVGGPNQLGPPDPRNPTALIPPGPHIMNMKTWWGHQTHDLLEREVTLGLPKYTYKNCFRSIIDTPNEQKMMMYHAYVDHVIRFKVFLENQKKDLMERAAKRFEETLIKPSPESYQQFGGSYHNVTKDKIVASVQQQATNPIPDPLKSLTTQLHELLHSARVRVEELSKQTMEVSKITTQTTAASPYQLPSDSVLIPPNKL
jgi:hypothetical protein